MRIQLKDGLPFTRVELAHGGKIVQIPDVLIDTGSATTMFSADVASRIDIRPEDEDILYTIRGVGGVEVVFSRRVERLIVGGCTIGAFEIEVGGMDYGFDIHGILGMDFLVPSGAVINLQTMEIEFSR